ncbi:MAG: replicative DNA helicase [Erysipelotrichia bacterium]|nr:replicative DNA helicase [Erysipelotrichia bacterium]
MATKSNQFLPYNIDAEKAVLGSALLSSDAFYNVTSSLVPEDFYEGRHQIIFKSMLTLLERKIPVDVLTIATELNDKKELLNIGGSEYLGELSASMISFGNLQFYIDIVLDQSVARNMLKTIREIDKEFLNKEIDNTNDFILKSEELFKNSIARRHISSFIGMDVAAERLRKHFDAQKEFSPNESAIIGLTSGYNYIDNLTQGFQKGELTIIAARPSVGKTALALNFAYNVAAKENVTVAIFSLEMTSDLLTKRLVASQAGVNLRNINLGRFYGQDRSKVAAALNEVGNSKIFIDDSSGIKLLDIIAKTRKLQAANPDLGLVIVDYLGLVQAAQTSKTPDSRQEEVRKISLALKGMAKELKVPVVVVSQLSRDVEKRRDSKIPMLSDLRDSGSIEQDADVVMLMYREDYYSSQKKTEAGDKKVSKLSNAERFELARQQKERELGSTLPGNASYVELNIAKNRNGATGVVPLFFYKDYGRFEEPTKAWIDAMKELEENPAAE